MTVAYTLGKVCAAVFIVEKKKIELLMSVVLIVCAWILAGKGWERASSSRVETGTKKWTVVLDAGHGGTLVGPKEPAPFQLKNKGSRRFSYL